MPPRTGSLNVQWSSVEIELKFSLQSKFCSHPCEQISQPVSRQNHPPISNPTRTDNVTRRKHGSRLNLAATLVPGFRNPDLSPILVSDFRRNLEALFS